MNNNANEKLLRDLLRDEAEGFRQELFEASLTELRRRNRKEKRSFSSWAIAAGFVLGAGLLFFGLAHRTGDLGGVQQARIPTTTPAPEYQRIEVVTTGPLKMAFVDNRRYPSVVVENSSAHHPVEILGDAELLALFPDKSAGLVANSEGAVQFVFLDPNDRASINSY